MSQMCVAPVTTKAKDSQPLFASKASSSSSTQPWKVCSRCNMSGQQRLSGWQWFHEIRFQIKCSHAFAMFQLALALVNASREPLSNRNRASCLQDEVLGGAGQLGGREPEPPLQVSRLCRNSKNLLEWSELKTVNLLWRRNKLRQWFLFSQFKINKNLVLFWLIFAPFPVQRAEEAKEAWGSNNM